MELYRYALDLTNGDPTIRLYTFTVLDITQNGYWISGYYKGKNKKRWINKTANHRRRFAFESKKEALEQLLRRTQSRRNYLELEFNACEIALNSSLFYNELQKAKLENFKQKELYGSTNENILFENNIKEHATDRLLRRFTEDNLESEIIFKELKIAEEAVKELNYDNSIIVELEVKRKNAEKIAKNSATSSNLNAFDWAVPSNYTLRSTNTRNSMIDDLYINGTGNLYVSEPILVHRSNMENDNTEIPGEEIPF